MSGLGVILLFLSLCCLKVRVKVEVRVRSLVPLLKPESFLSGPDGIESGGFIN